MDKRTLRSKKGRPRSARQNDGRNQGLFGRVYTTMRGMLKPPTWIINSVTNWIGNSDESEPSNSTDIREDIIREDSDVSHSVSQGSKRLRLRFDDNIPSIQSSGTQTWPDQPPQSLYDTVSQVVQSPTTQSSLLEHKEEIPVLNGDDHSENSEGSASTSGCSSLVSSHKDSSRVVGSPFHSLRSELKNSRKRKEPSSPKSGLDDLNSSRTLWSSGFSPSSRFQRRLPTISHTNQPSFNLSSFVGPSKLNESLEKKITSPFYEGRTTYGGASASRRMPPSVTPYQVDKTLRNQIRVREHSSNDSLEGMSSAAKRILLTLEKMSSPVTDAKKMPNSETSPVDLSLYLRPPKSRRNSQFTVPLSTKGPPIANINTIAKLTFLKNRGASRLRSSLQGSPVASVVQEGYNFGISPSNAPSEEVDCRSSGGKMKSKSKVHRDILHISSVAPSTDEKVPDLPNVPLPISKLPTFSFKTSVESSHSKGFTFSNPIEHDLSFNNVVPVSSFALPSSFDSKIEKNSDLQPKPFVFSSPIEHELPKNTVLLKENTKLPSISLGTPAVSSCSTWDCSECWVQNPQGRTTCIACETPRTASSKTVKSAHTLSFVDKDAEKNHAVSSSVSIPSATTFTFGASTSPLITLGTSKTGQAVKDTALFTSSNPVGTTWECDACWVRNPEINTKCVACETVRQKKDIKTKSINSSSVSKSSATWECNECWVKNASKESKCLACETPRSLKENIQGSGSISIPYVSMDWECKSCQAKNSIKESKCKSCETLSSHKNTSEVKNSTNNVFSTWECTSCWVRNPMKEKKCMACETLHPNADKTSGVKDTNGFKFSAPIQNSPITFKFGNYVCTAPSTVTTASFKFGIATSEPLTTTSTADFKFGNTACESQTTTNSTGFNFGVAANEPQTTTNSTGFKIGAPTSTSTFFSSAALTSNTSQVNKDGVNDSDSQNKNSANESDSVINKGTVNESSTLFGNNKVNEINTAIIKDVINENKIGIGKEALNEGFAAKSSETTSEHSKSSFDNKVSNSVITSISSETSVSKATVAPSVTACFSFTSQPVLDSKKSETFPFGTSKEKLSTSSVSSPFNVFPSPQANKDKLSENNKLLQPETKNINTKSDNKVSSAFQLTNQHQQLLMHKSPELKFLSSAPVFKFGDKTDSSKSNVTTISVASTTTATTSFSLTNNTPNYGSVVDSKPNEISSVSSEQQPSVTHPVSTEIAKVSSSINFPSASSSSFVFGSTVTTTAPTAFSFFPSSSSTTATTTTSTAASSVFTFGASVNTAQTSKSGGFTFKGLEKPQNVTSVSTASPVPPTSQPVTSALNPSATATVPGGGFVFGAPKTEAQSSATAPFTFGSGSTPSSNASAFSAFQPSQATNTNFQFGIQATSTTASAVGASSNFTFAKSDMSNQVPSSVSQNPASAFGSSANTFVFGSKNETSNQIPSTVSQASTIPFGSSTSSFSFNNKPENTNTVSQNPNPTFGGSAMQSVFGNASVPTFGGGDKPASGGFNFGGASSGVFQFGASNNTERKRTATASGFNFGSPAASEPSNQFQQGFNVMTPPSFNFGASSTPSGPGPFQFAASSAPKAAPSQNAPRKYRKALRRVRKD